MKNTLECVLPVLASSCPCWFLTVCFRPLGSPRNIGQKYGASSNREFVVDSHYRFDISLTKKKQPEAFVVSLSPGHGSLRQTAAPATAGEAQLPWASGAVGGATTRQN